MYLLDLLRNDIKNRTFKFIEYISSHHGEMNYNDNQEGYSIVGPAGFKNFIDICFKDEAYQSNIDMYRIIAYTNTKVSFWNNYIRNLIIEDSDMNSVDFSGEKLPSVPGHEIFSLKKAKENVKDYMNKNGYKFSTAIDEKRFNNYNENMTVNIERK